MNMAKCTYVAWLSLEITKRNVPGADHGLTSHTSKAAEPEARAAVRQYIQT